MSLITFEREFFAGVDVGQVNDWTAVAVTEVVRAVPRTGIHFGLLPQATAEAKETPLRLDLCHLERIPLGTLYPEQVNILRDLLRQPILGEVQTYLDMTGVGRPVHQMLKAAGMRSLHGISITGAQGEAKRQPYGWSVGKAELVNRVQIELQTGRLRLGRRLPDVDKLVRELKEFRAKPTANGHMTFNAREGQHDDLVLALSYAVFGALRPRPVQSIEVRFAS
ncbi:hypothetical protein [Lysobacter niastensis]|uniref:Terminase large subunit gp17-like C-terminal domain-containing protein n=1 Tax=Lysobacter niastensis TaxID=380629 RepID=A0ABS0B317_9GAMM|nr:hypothetical protein [Lysobacter niastensis]MBF6022867.1 hypothetical protein [Lysobacter niastensis]